MGKPTIDFGKLYQDIEQPISVTLGKLINIVDGEEQYEYYTVNNVLEREGTVDELLMEDVDLESEVKVYHLWREMLDEALEGLTPERFDLIITNYNDNEEVRYTIRKMRRHNRRLRYRCVCIKNVGEIPS